MELRNLNEVGQAADLFDDGYVGVRAELLARILDQCPSLPIGDVRSLAKDQLDKAIAFLSPAEVLQLSSYWLEMRERKSGSRAQHPSDTEPPTSESPVSGSP